MIDYQRISITIELPDTARHDLAAAQVLLKVISWLQDEHVHTGRVAMELYPFALLSLLRAGTVANTRCRLCHVPARAPSANRQHDHRQSHLRCR